MTGPMRWLGIEPNPARLREKLVSVLGAFVGIGLTALISLQFLGGGAALLMIGSMGASAVLLFAVPHGQLSQPWPAMVGQLVSATVGVACASLVPNVVVAAALAVSLAILVMHLSRSMHPPGGATALIAVIGGPGIHALGWTYVLAPVALNAMTILLVALVFNNLFGWRRYPVAWQHYPAAPAGKTPLEAAGIDESHILHVLADMDSPIDVTASELLEILRRADRQARNGS